MKDDQKKDDKSKTSAHSDHNKKEKLEDENLKKNTEPEEVKDEEDEEEIAVTSTTDERDQKIEELTNALARAMADLQNFKRRSEEEKGSFIRFANSELLKSLLPFVDNLERSVSHLPETLKEDTWAKGIVHIHTDLLKTMETLGIKKIKTVGEKLNPEKHEGLMSGPGEKDVIIEEFEPGYLLGDTVIKVAKVKVGNGT